MLYVPHFKYVFKKSYETITVPADIIVITCAGESPAQVVCGQLMFGIATVATGSGTMNDDEVDKSHFL